MSYYQILGVLPSAEDIVIRAAYRALAQRYHPDRWTGEPAEAHRRMQAINEAFAVLDDVEKRKTYDQSRKSGPGQEAFDADENIDAAFAAEAERREADWALAVEYYPDLTAIIARLRNTSHSLAFAFQTLLLEQKQFEKRHELASDLESRFLETFFGTNAAVLMMARDLIRTGERAAALELNRVVRVLGNSVDVVETAKRLERKYQLSSRGVAVGLNALARDFLTRPEVGTARKFIESMGGSVSIVAIWKYPQITVKGHVVTFESEMVLLRWMRKEFVPRVLSGHWEALLQGIDHVRG